MRLEDLDQTGGAAQFGDPLPDEPTTELGYAHRLILVYGDRLRYVPAWRRWLVWDGKRWAHDTTGQSARWMKSIARRVTADALAIEDDQKRKAALNAARRGESSAGVAGALTLAGTEAGIVVTPDDLDADPYLLNCANGTFDLRTGELRAHDPADLLTKMTGAAYRPGGIEDTTFGRFLRRVQPDPAMREFLARLLGHALEGRVTAHILPIMYGAGANGKSTFIDAIASALGDYAAPADPELLTARTFDAHPTGVADLVGLRLAVLHETDAGRRLAEGTVKRLTGGDPIKARRMREDFWTFTPSHTFCMLTNHKPIVTGTDEGIWRRLRLVPWDVVVPPEERDEGLGEKLALELNVVLAWLASGHQDWKLNGFGEPEAVREATQKFRDESDAMGKFLHEACLLGEAYHVGASDLFAYWSKWCAGQGEDPGNQTTFAAALQNKGLDNYTSKGRRRWRGIGIPADDKVEG